MAGQIAKIAAAQSGPEATVSEAVAIISMIERAARDPSVDVDKMSRLFEMHLQASAQRAERDYNAAMAAAQAELLPVGRTHRNNQTNSYYADLAAITEAATPILSRHGFGLIFSECESPKAGHIGLSLKVTHAGGHSANHVFHIPTDAGGLRGNANKVPTHVYASTLTYGRRYALCAVFNIATKNDVDGSPCPPPSHRAPPYTARSRPAPAPERPPASQPAPAAPVDDEDGELASPELCEEIEALIAETGTDRAALYKYFQIEQVSDLTRVRACEARILLLRKRQRQMPDDAAQTDEEETDQ